MPLTSKEQNSAYKYQVGGSLQIDAPSYVERQADIDFYDELKAGEFCYVLNSRQMGKSSLRVQTMRKLQADDIACGVIDVTAIGSQDITPAEWYLGVLRRLVRSFTPKVKALTWWGDCSGLSPVQRLSEFIESVLLAEVSQNIVIFVDEIDSVLKLKFKDDFWALLRACYNKRADNPAYQRLTFALLGVATPYDLITDKNSTPFNIGRAIQLNGFQLSEAQPLLQGLVGRVINPQAVLKEVLAWTGGQPFLTQKLCQLVLTFTSPIPAGSEAKCVEHLVHSQIIKNWESQDEPEHLKTIRDRILRSEQRTGRLLRLYQQILLKNETTADSSPEQMQLRLSGLVVKQQGSLRVYNRIYASVFNRSWVDKALSNLRPYESALEAWVATNYQDKSQLLCAQALQDAQAWAKGRSLSAQDYQFLAASKELNTQERQIALEEQRARQLLPKKRCYQTVLLLSMAVTTVIMGLRQLGQLENLELKAFDRLMQLRPSEAPDSRLLVVAITEADIRQVQNQRSGSLSDRSLAQLLEKLEQYKPRVIGLDIYRDFPVERKYADLATRLRQNSNLVAICKVTDPKDPDGIPPPPEIPLERQGFSDFLEDSDGVLRRHLLTMTPEPASPCTTPYAFNVLLAFHYLAAKRILPKFTSEGNLQLGSIVFKRLKASVGGYQRIDTRGNQLLLNYRSYYSPQDIASSVTLSQILSDRVNPDLVKDRVVLIGVTAASAGDDWSTPYGSGPFQRVSGVVVHAQIVSQIISAVLDGRTLLWVWPFWGEVLWIWGWSLVGGMLAWRFRTRLSLGVVVGTAMAALYGICFSLLTQGGWVPLVPSTLTLVVTGGSVALCLPSGKNSKNMNLKL